MKKFLILFAFLAALSSPAVADSQDDHDNGIGNDGGTTTTADPPSSGHDATEEEQ